MFLYAIESMEIKGDMFVEFWVARRTFLYLGDIHGRLYPASTGMLQTPPFPKDSWCLMLNRTRFLIWSAPEPLFLKILLGKSSLQYTLELESQLITLMAQRTCLP